MPRHARSTLANVTYHIIHRGNNKQAIFFGDGDYLYFRNILIKAKERYECRLYAYVLMMNHIHLLVEPLIAEHLAKFMKTVAQKHTQHVNSSYRRSGTLWEGRFKSSPVSMDNYLLACCRYIELNPVRAGLVDNPGDYKWSSYAGKIGLREDKLLDFDIWFNSLGENKNKRQRAYRQWFEESIPEDEWVIIREAVNRGGVFGAHRFRQQIEESIGRKMEFRRRGRPKKET